MIKFAIVLFNPTTFCELSRTDHAVPTARLLSFSPSGTIILAAVHLFASPSLRVAGFEDEDDDDDEDENENEDPFLSPTPPWC